MINVKMKKIIFIIFLLVFSLITIFVFSGVFIVFYPFTASRDAKDADVLVRWGNTFSAIADSLEQKNVIQSAKGFLFTVELFKKTNELRAGKFTLKTKMSNYSALQALINGPQTYIKLTLPEGYNSKKYASLVQKQLQVDSLKFISLVYDTFFVRELQINAPSLEGYIYPETYHFTYGVNAKQIISTCVNKFKNRLNDSLHAAIQQKNMILSDIVILASIIEGEAIFDNEMSIISSVYHNRLAKGMKLQADPTIQYIISDGPRRLLSRDLTINSPYNTYLYAGLPPGPIGNPGIEAIKAAIFPAQTNYLYFVAKGDGSHIFSNTYHQHLEAKKQFDKIRQQVAMEKRRKAIYDSKN